MEKPLLARPVKNPDFDAIEKDVVARYPVTLAYLARSEIEDRRAADPWPWLDELLAHSKRNGSRMSENWDTPPDDSK